MFRPRERKNRPHTRLRPQQDSLLLAIQYLLDDGKPHSRTGRCALIRKGLKNGKDLFVVRCRNTYAIVLYKELILRKMLLVVDLHQPHLLVIVFYGVADEIGKDLEEQELFRIYEGERRHLHFDIPVHRKILHY